MALKLFKKKEKEGISSNSINIVIYRLMSDRTPIVVGEFNSLQIKDSNLNLNLVNEEYNFKEELDRKRHHLLEYLQYKLDISSSSKEEKINKIDIKIKSIQDKIKNIKEGKIDDKKVNLIDLQTDLRHIKVLKYVVQYEGEGSFEIINQRGQREMRFLARDSIFIPYFHRSDTDNSTVLSMFPDIGLSRKYHKEIDDKIEQRYADKKNDHFFSGIKGIIITLVIAALVIGNIIFMNRNFEAAKEIDSKLDEYRQKCNQQAVDCAFYYGKLVEDEIINRSIDPTVEAQKNKKTTSALVDITKDLTGTG